MKIDAIVDLQFGSTGKGLIAGHLSAIRPYTAVVTANMPNAGHTYIDRDGRKYVHKVLPSGVFSSALQYIMIGPGAVFDPAQLVKEYNGLVEAGVLGPGSAVRVVIHPEASVLSPEHREAEQKTLSKISSTMQGSMEAMVQKLKRDPDRPVTAHNLSLYLSGFKTADGNCVRDMVVTRALWVGIVTNPEAYILMEGAQGYSLGINAGFHPYCTSRDCTVWRFIADCGLMPEHDSLTVIGTARVHPIRVGNTADGHSGGHYSDQREMSWEELGQTPELTTVTQRVRRVFSFSVLQIEEAMRANRVDQVFLNFANYAPREAIAIANQIDNIAHKMRTERMSSHGLGFAGKTRIVKWMGWGPAHDDVQEL